MRYLVLFLVLVGGCGGDELSFTDSKRFLVLYGETPVIIDIEIDQGGDDPVFTDTGCHLIVTGDKRVFIKRRSELTGVEVTPGDDMERYRYFKLDEYKVKK
jgi:hypothetical protein